MILLVYATVATPILCRPLTLGTDLALHSVITAVRYLGLIGDPWHRAAVAQFATGFGGMLLFQTGTSAARALAVCGATRLFRLSVGLEHPDDLIVDLAEALRS